MENLLALLVVVVLIVAVVAGVIAIYNRLVMLRNNVDKAYANIDVLLKQRADEIPDLIAVVRENTAYERGVLHALTELRTRFLASESTDEKVALSNQLSRQLKSLFAVSEGYPELRANAAYQQLQARVSGIEDRIAARRELFNDSVNLYNIGIQEFPSVILATMLGDRKRAMLEIGVAEVAYNGPEFA